MVMINKTRTKKKNDRNRISQTKTYKFRPRILHIEKKKQFSGFARVCKRKWLFVTKAQMVMKEPMNQNKCLIPDAIRLLWRSVGSCLSLDKHVDPDIK